MTPIFSRSFLLPLALLAIVFGPACSALETLAPPRGEEARWGLDPTALVPVEATSLPLLVNEIGCASGRSAEGRISAQVHYGADSIAIIVLVAPAPGDAQECPSNPNTPYTLELSEPFGGRMLVNAATSELAQRPIEFVGDGPGPGNGADGGVLITPLGSVNEAQAFIAEALHARGQDPSELGDLFDLSLDPDGVELILGDSGFSHVVPHDDLADPENWYLRHEGPYNGHEGPFSALEILKGRNQLDLTIGDHPHCAGPARAAPSHLADHTRLGITPSDAESCIEWFAIDLYIGDNGRVQAIVIDFWEP